ncbi:hypothetical protein ACH5RR_039669 [Cinchona calisaya]|uniref:RING-type E3 ubiquitin transferase n=1 Tax=Cinchona calisaya TaxID=153742 RepID=A0ABD2Y1G2_9GENT
MQQKNSSRDINMWKLRILQVCSLTLLKKTSIIILFSALHVKAQDDPIQHPANPLHPNLAVSVGILTIVVSISFLLMAYAKLCHSDLSNDTDDLEQDHQGILRSISGIERRIIDSLPFFTFSSLKGSKQGLECAVCLSKFEETDVLRLLPRCKHAFHRNCIDKWLENHSSCPLCRYKFEIGDLMSSSFTNSLRYPGNNLSNLSDEPNVEMFIQREQEIQKSSGKFNTVSSLLKLGIGRKNDTSDRDLLHKFKHKIIVSGIIYKSRWSDVNSSDLLFLNSEMLNLKSSKRFSSFKPDSQRFPDEYLMNESILKIKEDIERKRGYESKVSRIAGNSISATSSPTAASNIGLNQNGTSKLNSVEKRSMSEIINISRYLDYNCRNRANHESLVLSRSERKDEIIRRLWLPIATRTVQWFAGRERGLEYWKKSPLNV